MARIDSADGRVMTTDTDPRNDPNACSKCGVYIGSFPDDDYCEPCAREIGVKPPMERCLHCGQDAPQEVMEPINLAGDDEYYPKIKYLCGGCSGND